MRNSGCCLFPTEVTHFVLYLASTAGKFGASKLLQVLWRFSTYQKLTEDAIQRGTHEMFPPQILLTTSDFKYIFFS